MRRIHIPRLDLEVAGVTEETARQVVERLPAALTRALSAVNGNSAPGNAPGSADALADQAARRIAATLRSRSDGKRR